MPLNIMQCPVCGYIATQGIDFHLCPVCNSPSDMFRPFTTLSARGIWDEKSIVMIMEMAETGRHALEGKGTTRSFPNFSARPFWKQNASHVIPGSGLSRRTRTGNNGKKPSAA